MKWIGQHIWDFISRFRNDIYLENISSGTIASGGNLGLDSNNKIVKATAADGDITAVRLSADDGGTATQSSGSADFTIAGGSGIDTSIADFTVTITPAAATTSSRGVVELATTAETTTGTDTVRAVTPDGLKDGYQGSTNVTTLGTIATGTWQGTKITDIYTNSSGKRYGNTIKILPSDFMINEDAASPLSFKDGGNSGVHINDTANEALAFVTIPEGMKATHVDVYATHNRTLKVWEVDLNASFDFTSTTKGTGSCNTQLDITDVNATATNYLAIQVALSATTQRIWGGIVTIAAQ